jgi:ParB/RepB/Spo0J family partition protein
MSDKEQAMSKGVGTNPVPPKAEEDNPRYVDMDVDPADVLIDPDIKALRQWTGESRQEGTIKELADSIIETGQLQRCVAWMTPDGISLIIGNRRLEAVKLAREEGNMDIFLEIKIDNEVQSKEQAVKMAMDENRRREQFTEFELCTHIPFVRTLLKAEGKKGTKQVADFIGIDPATVTQYERLLAAPQELQDSVRTGRMTVTAALETLTSKPETVKQVSETAHKAAEARAEKQTKEKEKKEKEKAAKEGAKPKKVTPVKPVTTTTDVRRAQRKVAGALSKPKAPRGTEWADFFLERSGPANPPILAQFASIMADWGSAKATDAQAEEAWKTIVQAMKSAGIADKPAPELKEKGPEGKKKAEKAVKAPKAPKAPAPKKAAVKTAAKKAPAKVAAKKAPAAKKTPVKSAKKK